MLWQRLQGEDEGTRRFCGWSIAAAQGLRRLGRPAYQRAHCLDDGYTANPMKATNVATSKAARNMGAMLTARARVSWNCC